MNALKHVKNMSQTNMQDTEARKHAKQVSTQACHARQARQARQARKYMNKQACKAPEHKSTQFSKPKHTKYNST